MSSTLLSLFHVDKVVFAGCGFTCFKHTDKHGKVNVDSMLAVGKQYLYSRPAKSFEITERAIAIAKEQKDQMQLASSYRSIGAIFTLINTDLDSSFHYLESGTCLP